MKLILKIIIIIIMFVLPMLSYSEEYLVDAGTTKIWKIGYIESGDVPLFNNSLKGFIKQLIKDGYIPNIDQSVFDSTDNKYIWNELSKINKSNLKFVKNAFLNNDWDDSTDEASIEKMCKCIKENDLDVVLVMGTLAAQKCLNYNNDKKTIFIIMGASNVYIASITKSGIYSGYKNIFATIDPYKYKQQIKVFHTIVGFNKLGIVYNDTTRNRTYSGIDDIEYMSKKLGFEIVTCFSNPEERDMEKAVHNLEKCHNYLSTRTDAVYVTIHGALLNYEYAHRLALPFLKNNIPTLVQEDKYLINHGFLMAIVPELVGTTEGIFVAKNFEKILNGAVPGELDMRFHEKTFLYINKKVAEEIEFKIPQLILMIADKVYERREHEQK